MMISRDGNEKKNSINFPSTYHDKNDKKSAITINLDEIFKNTISILILGIIIAIMCLVIEMKKI